jgi:hypothetical protein
LPDVGEVDKGGSDRRRTNNYKAGIDCPAINWSCKEVMIIE